MPSGDVVFVRIGLCLSSVVVGIDADECTEVEGLGAIVPVSRCGQRRQGGGERLRSDALPAEEVPDYMRQVVPLAGGVAAYVREGFGEAAGAVTGGWVGALSLKVDVSAGAGLIVSACAR